MGFTPPYPRPHKARSTSLLRFIRGWHSWLHVLFERSYFMKMGQVGSKFFMVNEPKYVSQILVEQQPKYPKHPLLHALLEPLLGSSIFTTNGAVWERQRRLVDQGFQNARLLLVFPLMKNAVDDMLARLDRVADGRSYEVDGEMTYITADVMFRTILSERLDRDEAAQVYTAFLAYQQYAQRSMMLSLYGLPAFLWKRGAARTAAQIRAPLTRIIARRYEQAARGEPQKMDILGTLMEAVDPVEGNRFTETETLDQICMLFLAGHETSASALAWALYLLSHSPEIQERMREEIRAEIGERDFEYGDARKFRLTLNVFRETLRLYPPVGFFVREATESHCMRDKQIDKGSAIMVSPWLIQRHRDHWERPDEFDPDRFETAEGKASAKCAYLPFSMGPRVCIGQAFAVQEGCLVLASIVRRYYIKVDAKHVPKTVGRVTIRSDNGIRVRLERTGA